MGDSDFLQPFSPPGQSVSLVIAGGLPASTIRPLLFLPACYRIFYKMGRKPVSGKEELKIAD